MKHEFAKCLGLVSATMCYCHSHGADDFDINIKHLDSKTTAISISCEIKNFKEEEIGLIRKKLDTIRQHEVEEELWGLACESEYGDELMLVGSMTDCAEVSYKSDILNIKLKRKGN